MVKLLQTLMEKAAETLSGERYRPEQHYMRGPGPKANAKATRGGGAGRAL